MKSLLQHPTVYSRVVKLDELKKELESKKNRKFQEKCILIAQVLLGEDPVVEYRPSFMGGLELDAFPTSSNCIVLAGIEMSKNLVDIC
ncbi:unnamed protein product [Rhizophagus irregularis]|nr:unnamed protein product [Rhizophagus irregularis]